MPKVSYIVSAYDRPEMLRCCLASLAVQTDGDFEVLVADNAPTFKQQVLNDTAAMHLNDGRFRHYDTDCVKTCAGWDCYHSAEYVARHWAKGEWVCFPSDDSYYVPIFQEVMLYQANGLGRDMVYCDWLCDRRGHGEGFGPGRYHWVNAEAKISRIDKTGFLVKRALFVDIGFPGKNMDEVKPCAADGELIEGLVRRGVPHCKVNEILMVHN